MTMVISVKTKALLDEAMALSFHKHHDMDIDAVLHDALECYVASEKKRKFAVTDHPRPRAGDGQAERDSVSAEAKREVYARDAGQCAYIGQDGVRCTSRVGVEIDHITPRAKHGGHQAENLRLACPAHNGLAAEEALGQDFMKRRRQQAELERQVHSALVHLDYKPKQARLATRAAIADTPSLELDAVIRAALRHAANAIRGRV